MAVNRILTMIIIGLAIVAIVGLVLPLALMYFLPVSIGPTTGDLIITDVQFYDEYLNVTVKNTCTKTKIVNQVKIRNLEVYNNENFVDCFVDWNSPPHIIAMYIPLSVGEKVSIRLNYNWISGQGYRIQLETEDPKDWSPATEYNSIAP